MVKGKITKYTGVTVLHNELNEARREMEVNPTPSNVRRHNIKDTFGEQNNHEIQRT